VVHRHDGDVAVRDAVRSCCTQDDGHDFVGVIVIDDQRNLEPDNIVSRVLTREPDTDVSVLRSIVVNF
jgi:hypothetical protein